MAAAGLFRNLIVVWIGMAIVTFVLLFFKTAPYGRHMRSVKGPTVNGTLGWIVMETSSLLLMLVLYITGNRRGNIAAAVFLGMWLFHYSYRSFVFPPLRRGGENRMPLVIVFAALFFNTVNAYINGRYLFFLSPIYPDIWLKNMRFVAGAFLFTVGLTINIHSDHVLRRLRNSGERDYKIPYGGLYTWVSCPNYLGEIVEWVGWAVATWSLPGTAFALWTIANLAPRSLSHHRWYKKRFEIYPSRRKALIPFLF